MGSSGGIIRGQLRPQFAGRNSPFLVAGLCIALVLLALTYYNLSNQYMSLQGQLSSMVKSEDRERTAYQEKSKEADMLQKLVEQLRERLEMKTKELKGKQSDFDKLRQSQQLSETNLASEKSRLEIEIKDLTDKSDQLQKSKDDLEAENMRLKNQLDSAERLAKEKETQIDQLNSKIVDLNAKMASRHNCQENKGDVEDNKDAVEMRTEDGVPVMADLGPGDIDQTGQGSNRVGDGRNAAEEGPVKESPYLNSPLNNNNNDNSQKASLPKPSSVIRPDTFGTMVMT